MLKIAFAELPAHAGRELGVSDWLTVDQPMIDRFAEATGDFQWIHVDRERAARELGGTLAHGYLTLSLVPRLAATIYEVTGVTQRLNYGLDRLRFPAPVPAGSRLRLRLALAEVAMEGPRCRIGLDATMEREGSGRPVCVARLIVLLLPD